MFYLKDSQQQSVMCTTISSRRKLQKKKYFESKFVALIGPFCICEVDIGNFQSVSFKIMQIALMFIFHIVLSFSNDNFVTAEHRASSLNIAMNEIEYLHIPASRNL